MYNKRSGKYQCVSIKEDINNNKQQHTPYAKALMNLGEGGGGFASHFVSPATYKHYRGPSCFMLMFLTPYYRYIARAIYGDRIMHFFT
ncbi:hypothetical protein ACSS6W_004583 [Trichoderma asperelloides]